MILTGSEIIKQYDEGRIKIDPFDEKRVNPNSYNLSLHNELLIYTPPKRLEDPFENLFGSYLDVREKPTTARTTIPEEGYILNPGTLYLGRTQERAGSSHFVPVLDGRSSTGRLGIFLHCTAGFGDVGFYGFWTLEIVVVHPIKVYPGMECCQIRFHSVMGDTDIQYNGKYNNADDIQESRLWKEFQ